MCLHRLKTDSSKLEFKTLANHLKTFTNLAYEYGCTVEHIDQASKLITSCEDIVANMSIPSEIVFKHAYKLVNTFVKLGHRVDLFALSSLKYAVSPGSESKIRSPIVTLHGRAKLSLARLYIVLGDLGIKA